MASIKVKPYFNKLLKYSKENDTLVLNGAVTYTQANLFLQKVKKKTLFIQKNDYYIYWCEIYQDWYLNPNQFILTND